MNQLFIVFVGVVFSGQAAAQFFSYTTSQSTLLISFSPNFVRDTAAESSQRYNKRPHRGELHALAPEPQTSNPSS